MKSLQVLVLIVIVCCDYVLAIPLNASVNNVRSLTERFNERNLIRRPPVRATPLRLGRPSPLAISHSPESMAKEDLTNFKPNDDLSDKTFEIAIPMEFDNRINKIGTLARQHPLHGDWLRIIVQMAEMNKQFAHELSFSILPMNKATMRNVKKALDRGIINADEKLLTQLDIDLNLYVRVVDDLRNRYKKIVEQTLFEQFDFEKFRELVQFDLSPANRKNLLLRTKTEIEETETIGKLIIDLSKELQQHFKYTWPKAEYSRRPQVCENDMNKLFDLYLDNKVAYDYDTLRQALEKLHNRQKNFINMLVALKRIAEKQRNQ